MRELLARGTSVPAGLRRASHALAQGDPWRLLHRVPPGVPVFAWSDRAGSHRFVAIGAAARLRASVDRFAAARAWLQALPTDDFDAPLAVGGFAFASTGGWSGWPAAELTVPRLLIEQRGAQTRAIAAHTEDTAADDLLAWLGAAWDAPESPRSSAPRLLDADAESASSWPGWRDLCARALGALGQGMDKVVLARAAALADGVDPVALARQLRSSQPGCTAFLVRREHGSALVGATPEDLVRVRGRTAETMALAGTRHAAADAAELTDSAKDEREQAMVVDAIQAALARVCTDVSTHPRQVARFADVQHLRTALSGTLRDGATVLDVVEALHPTPAVGGLPRDAATDWLAAHEPLDRGWYAGPIGWVGRDAGVFGVALRCARIEAGHAVAFAGCGVLPESDPRAEHAETRLKLAPLRRALAALGEDGA